MNEQGFAGRFVYDAEFFCARRVRARKSVKNKDLAVLQISGQLVFDRITFFFGDRYVYAAPGDIVMNAGECRQ